MNRNNDKIKLALLLCTPLLFSACSSNPPVDTSENNTVVVGSEPIEESSGIAPPSQEMEAAPVENDPSLASQYNMDEPPRDDMMATEMNQDNAASVESSMMADENLSTMAADRFAVQLVAASSMDKLRTFASSNGFSDNLTAEINSNGKTWYVLLLGTYATKEEAKQALSTVKDNLKTSPWIRTIGSLQNVMVR